MWPRKSVNCMLTFPTFSGLPTPITFRKSTALSGSIVASFDPFNTLLINTVIQNSSGKPCFMQNVRHYGKPVWVPMAKSKTNVVVTNLPTPRQEFEEVDELRETNKVYYKSLWEIQRNISGKLEIKLMGQAIQTSEELEIERMAKLNEVENRKVQKIRDDASAEEWKKTEQQILETKRLRDEEGLTRLMETEKLVENEMERLKTSIKEEDLVDAIQTALAVEHDHNYALSRKGEILPGRLNACETVDGPRPSEPLVRPVEIEK